MVRGAVKAQAARASQVRCTCSMQGLNEQKTPSGRRHASADLATCDTSACTLAPHNTAPCSSALWRRSHIVTTKILGLDWQGLQCAADLPGAWQVQKETICPAVEIFWEAVLLYVALPHCDQLPKAMAACEHVPV